MKKIFNFISKNVLLLLTLFLLAFIPLYPKLPIVDVTNTWVYVRIEDFIISAILVFWIFLVLKKKVKLKTPLTVPILLYWLIGAISTLHGVLIFFPDLPNIFSNVALLSFFRRIEYVSLFFIAYSSIKEKRHINYVIGTLVITLVLVFLYGLGQKLFGFPAFLTGNEEFAKGIPLRISFLGRVPSTFAGHYDLAAYLVLIIPLLTSLAFGFKNILLKILLLFTSLLGFGLLFMTVSRVSFFVLLISLLGLLLFQRKKLIIALLLAATLLFAIFSPALLQRFGSTVSEVNVLVNARSGAAISQVKEVSREYFKDKAVLIEGAEIEDLKTATSSSVIYPYIAIPQKALLLIQPNAPTGENLPQGTGYVNLPLSPIVKRSALYFTEKEIEKDGTKSAEVRVFEGNFLVKKARAYDLSFTTRFQGEWPRAIDTFRKNIFLGSGYGSLGLAVDNDYLRLLGEGGLIGFASFALLFLVAAIYIKKAYPKVESPVVRAFSLGFIAGTFGLLLNAVLIDVFEASKIAFTYWLLMGVTLGALNLYNPVQLNIFKEVKTVLTHPLAVAFYLTTLTTVLFFPMFSNYFVGDDFTWLRWAADSKASIIDYFTKADGFFYRPGARLYFFGMYELFWLNQTIYHLVSIILHAAVVLLLFSVFKKILKDYTLTIIATLLFVILSSYHEAVFWISATGILFTTMFSLLALLLFIYWKEKKRGIFLTFSLISILLSFMFHELGVVTPFIIIAYDLVFGGKSNVLIKKFHVILLLPLLPYLALRFLANSHWFSGDYSYNLLKLPFNVIGNTVGYSMLTLLGPQSLGIYEGLRNLLRVNIAFAGVSAVIVLLIVIFGTKAVFKRLDSFERKIVIFGILFFIISLMPFLGLGNIASRYGYLASVGFVIPLALFVKKIVVSLQGLGEKYTTTLIIILLSLVFISMHLFQLQKLHQDWEFAGKISKTFLISVEEVYKDSWRSGNLDFYFVNVPIKNGDAWVFPVGLEDALFLTFQNQNLSIYKVGSPAAAFSQITDPKKSSVFKFAEDGSVAEIFIHSKLDEKN